MTDLNFTGTPTNDVINGSENGDIINGLSGDDQLFGAAGDDQLFGAEGSDLLVGDAGNDIVVGDAGNDRIVWNNGDGSDITLGGSGEDVNEINGAAEAGDRLVLKARGSIAQFNRTNLGRFQIDSGGVETVEVNALGGGDTLKVEDLSGTEIQQVLYSAGDGNDRLRGKEANVSFIADGGAGDDILAGGSQNDRIGGGDGNDKLMGEGGNDVLVGDGGSDEMNGGDGNDLMIWNNGDGSDLMKGDGGNDTGLINGAEAGDEFELRGQGKQAFFQRTNLGAFAINMRETETVEVNGLAGDDRLLVSALSQTEAQRVVFKGGDGNDELDASSSDTSIIGEGGMGDDTLLGGSADDILNGGAGNNRLAGGAGADTFIVGLSGFTVIDDFDFAQGDTIQLDSTMLADNGLGSTEDVRSALSYDNSSSALSYNGSQIAIIENLADKFDINSQLTIA